MRKIATRFTPSTLNQLVKDTLEQIPLLKQVAVEGEISNCKWSGGHCYFSLKDSRASITCVMFKSQASRLSFTPENGMQVVATGHTTLYVPGGQYQLSCQGMSIQGQGDLQLAMEQLKAKLQQEGLFDVCHKKPLPPYPKQVLLLTSPTGSVVRDMLRIFREQAPSIKILVLPVPVQGANAISQNTRALQWAGSQNLGDLIILGRGGGSKEDLSAYNDEQLARAIFHCPIPVISAVGHEPDISISDYVADVTAATPTHAAEIAAAQFSGLGARLVQYQQTMFQGMEQRVAQYRQQLRYLEESSGFRDPRHLLQEKQQMLSHLQDRLEQGMTQHLQTGRHRCASISASLHALSPMAVMGRGYAIPRNQEGSLLHSVEDAQVGDSISLSLADGILHCTTTEIEKKEGDSHGNPHE